MRTKQCILPNSRALDEIDNVDHTERLLRVDSRGIGRSFMEPRWSTYATTTSHDTNYMGCHGLSSGVNSEIDSHLNFGVTMNYSSIFQLAAQPFFALFQVLNFFDKKNFPLNTSSKILKFVYTSCYMSLTLPNHLSRKVSYYAG